MKDPGVFTHVDRASSQSSQSRTHSLISVSKEGAGGVQFMLVTNTGLSSSTP